MSRVLITIAFGILAFFMSPHIIANRAFQILATLIAIVFTYDFHYIRLFYARFFSVEFLKLNTNPKLPLALYAPQIVFSAVIGLFMLGSIFHPVILGTFYNSGPVLIGSLSTLILLPSLFRVASRAGKYYDSTSTWIRSTLLAAVLVLISTIQILIGRAVQYIPFWDAGTVFRNAAGLAAGTQTTVDTEYFSMYPNNVMLTLALKEYFLLMRSWNVTDLFQSAVVLNSLVMTASVWLTFLVARRIAGSGLAVFTLGPVFAFITLSPWIAVPYSDTLGMVFPIFLLLLFLISRDTNSSLAKLSLWVVMGLTAAVGFYVKPTIIFVLIAAVAVMALTLNVKRFGWKQVGFVAASSTLALGFFLAGSTSIKTLENNSGTLSFDLNNNDKAFPATHFLKMGATGIGAFSQDDVIKSQSIALPQERFQNGLDVYFERVNEMGLWDYTNFLFTKGKSITGDGSFFIWGEGMAAKPIEFESTDRLSVNIREYFYFEGSNYIFMKGFWQSTWFTILALVAMPVILRGRILFGAAGSTMRLSLLALVMFLLLFEGRSRYLYMYMPFFILLASMTVMTVHQHVTAIAAPLRERKSSPQQEVQLFTLDSLRTKGSFP